MTTTLYAPNRVKVTRVSVRRRPPAELMPPRNGQLTPRIMRQMSASGYGRIVKATNYGCLHCGRICISPQGIGGHLYSAHGIPGGQAVQGRDWHPTRRIAF